MPPPTQKVVAPYGSWPSPIAATLLTGKSVRLSQAKIDAEAIWWLESRPQEQGRNTLMRQPFDGTAQEMTAAPLNLRSGVNEYGGGDYCLATAGSDGGHHFYFVNAKDQQVYAGNRSGETQQITRKKLSRFADLQYDHGRARLIAIEEDFDTALSSVHRLVAIDLADGAIQTLAEGEDFYASPALSPCGQQLSWLSWNHPHMPWSENQCWLAQVDQYGELVNTASIGHRASASFQPQWSPAGELFVVNDHSNWWNLYRWADNCWLPVLPMTAEFATPQWVFGMSCYGFLANNTLLCTYSEDGRWQLARIELQQLTAQLQPIETDFRDISSISAGSAGAAFLAASGEQATALWHYQIPAPAVSNDAKQINQLRQSITHSLAPQQLSKAQAISFATTGDADQPSQAHGFYYAPTNADYCGPAGDKPPLIVLSHGGPTAAAESSLNIKIQYWTNRGFAVLDVNYRGSTGYGRHYRQALNGKWGITDVVDVCAGAEYLVAQNLADPQRLIIKGSSAGGYTVLAALTFADTFSAGTSLYGIGDLEALATDTHKFESRYLDSLVGPYPAAKAVYKARSPIHHAQQLNCPVLFFQGLKDKVVPPNQAQAMVDALHQGDIKTAYVTFAEEGHGFRQAQSIIDALELELNFYGSLFAIAVQPRRQDFDFYPPTKQR